MVTARSGIVWSPTFLIASSRSLVSARRCRLGKFAFVTCTGKLPDGSVTSWRSPPPQAEPPKVRASAAIPVAILAAAPGSRCLPALVALAPKARGNIPPAAGSNRGFDRDRRWLCSQEPVGGGGEQPHGIHCFSAAAALGAEEKMVRTVADRAFLPAKSLFEQVGNMMILTGKTITATVRPP